MLYADSIQRRDRAVGCAMRTIGSRTETRIIWPHVGDMVRMAHPTSLLFRCHIKTRAASDALIAPRYDLITACLAFFPCDKFRRAQAVSGQHAFVQAAQFFHYQGAHLVLIDCIDVVSKVLLNDTKRVLFQI